MGSIEHPKKSAGGQLGKIDAPLGKKLQAVKWGEFRLGDLFDVLSYKQRFDANKVTLVENSGHPYIVRQGSDNGQKGFIDEDEIYLNDGNTISFGQDTATMFYQEKPYFTGDKIKILKPKMERFSKDNAQFFLATMRRSFSNFSWGTSSFSIGVIENQNITLPTTADNQIDFDFMESFIRELEEERVRELAAYLTASGLADTTLTASEQAALNAFDTLEWGEFRIGELFDVATGSLVSADKLHEGSIPRISVKTTDNGILGMYDTRSLHEARHHRNFISVNFFGNAFYHPYKASIEMKVHCLKIKNKDYTKESGLFFTALLNYILKDKFSYGDQLSSTDLKKLNLRISLPICNGSPDYAIMQDFISAVQKLVIKDVVAYADRKIAATKAVVGKT